MLSDLPKAESRMLVTRGWEGRGREAGVNRTGFRFCKMKTVLEMEGGDGGTMLPTYRTRLNCMSKNGSGGKFRIVYFITIEKKEADGSHSGGSQSRDPKVGLSCLGVLGLVGCSLLILC